MSCAVRRPWSIRRSSAPVGPSWSADTQLWACAVCCPWSGYGLAQAPPRPPRSADSTIRTGYRHLQMAAIITTYGDLTGNWTRSPQIAALDLLRSYAHDCLHFGTYRRYRMWNTSTGDEIGRVQYGINFRKNNGRTYSSPDRAIDRSTRNLGIVMEGATDEEPGWLHGTPLNERACRILTLWGRTTSRFATKPALLDGTDLSALKDPLQRTALADQPGAEEFLTNVRAYACGVGTRYESFLREIGREEADDLHQLILASMISGSLAQLSDWLNQRHGPAAFITIFKSPAYCGRYQGEGPKRSTAWATASFGVYPAERGSRTPMVIAGEAVRAVVESYPQQRQSAECSSTAPSRRVYRPVATGRRGRAYSGWSAGGQPRDGRGTGHHIGVAIWLD
jgi:hypothetical protein